MGNGNEKRGWVEKEDRHTGDSFVDPFSYALQNFVADFLASDSRGEELPVGFGKEVSVIKREAVFLADYVVPVALDLIDVAWNEAGGLTGLTGIRLQGFLGTL